MRATLFLFLLGIFFFKTTSFAQLCTGTGQRPLTAIRICDRSTIVQASVPTCIHRPVSIPCTAVTGRNPVWYQFTCFASGTMGFTIFPADLNDDYDWQLFDITGHFDNTGAVKEDDVYTDSTLFVACNWAANPGLTGASADGTSLQICDGFGLPTFSSMPVLQEGHEYLLLISHFDDSQSGYTLNFNSGTAAMTDTVPPHVKAAAVNCDKSGICIALNKKMTTASLSADGSEFIISPSVASVVAATMVNNNGLVVGLDSIELTLSKPLPAGNYSVNIKNGSDGNTFTDRCGISIPGGERITFSVQEDQPASIRSITKMSCAPDVFQLVIDRPVRSGSIAADGTDFIIEGSPAVSVISASGNGAGPFCSVITLTISSNIIQGNKYQLKLKRGSDGNALEDMCGIETNGIKATLPEKLVAAFDIPAIICYGENIRVAEHSTGEIDSWLWDFGNGTTSMQRSPQSPVYPYTANAQNYTVTLTVKDASRCIATSEKIIRVANDCHIAVPSAFTPNNDGLNDYLCPVNIHKASSFRFSIFNQYGQLVFETSDLNRKWDGSFRGQRQGAGTYIWMLEYTDRDNGKQFHLKGTSVLIR